jgi:3-hydroxy-9,10-secoandrosta-1,3,5(10)-triene-9,17-dione monooxygenase reductase component
VNSPFPEIDGAQFRHVLGHFLTGVTIITAVDVETGDPVGLAASSFTSVSMDPPLVLFCAGKSSSTWPKISASGNYCVNILAHDQQDWSRVFSSKGIDKFAGLPWHVGASGSPVLDDSLAWIDCTMHEEVDAGDHVIAIGRVVGMGDRGHGGPLAYFRGGYGVLSDMSHLTD